MSLQAEMTGARSSPAQPERERSVRTRPVETGRPKGFSREGCRGSGRQASRNLQHKKKEKPSQRGRLGLRGGQQQTAPPGAGGGEGAT